MPIIIGPIHHPGTGMSEILTIVENAKSLLADDEATPVMILGDYNHRNVFYEKDMKDTGFELKMPDNSTMAGFEYGNLNQAIDGVLTNRPEETTVDILNQKTFASQVALSIEVQFNL